MRNLDIDLALVLTGVVLTQVAGCARAYGTISELFFRNPSAFVALLLDVVRPHPPAIAFAPWLDVVVHPVDAAGVGDVALPGDFLERMVFDDDDEDDGNESHEVAKSD